MWTDKLKVGDLIIKKVSEAPDDRYGIVMEVRETNRPTYGAVTIDTARQEFKIWRGTTTSRWIHSWIQDVEVRALWRKP
jgi:hypothetical protein|tara:strand:- start:188 stop:424 length:237 start_codon:yes stop_codon:yes gene_type:complete